MNTTLAIGSVLFCCFSNSTLAATSAATDASSGNNAVDAALTACASTVTTDTNGQPDQQAMTTCMEGKGFTKPAGPPAGGQGNPPSKKK